MTGDLGPAPNHAVECFTLRSTHAGRGIEYGLGGGAAQELLDFACGEIALQTASRLIASCANVAVAGTRQFPVAAIAEHDSAPGPLECESCSAMAATGNCLVP